jgi:hypothetical protein
MRTIVYRIALILFVALCLRSAPAIAGGAAIAGFLPGAGLVHIETASLNDEKFRNIIRQQTDFSCGAAAIATLLNYAYGVRATEYGVIDAMLRTSDPLEVSQRGFSLLDMKHFASEIDMRGIGYKLSVDGLYNVQIPSIVLLSVDGYEHFVVLKKATPAYAYVADPALGNRRIPMTEFAKSWNNIIFVLASKTYDPNNPLTDATVPGTLADFMQGLPAAQDALGNAVLMSVMVPGTNRL